MCIPGIYNFGCFVVGGICTYIFILFYKYNNNNFFGIIFLGLQPIIILLAFSGHQRHFQVQIYVFPGKPLVQNANFPTIQCYFFAVFTCSLTFVYTNKYNFLVTSKLIYTVISIDTYQNEIIFKDSRIRKDSPHIFANLN